MNTEIIEVNDRKGLISEADIMFTFDIIKPHPIYEKIKNKIDYKYFQVYYEPENYNTLNIIYNGVQLIEYYLNEYWPMKDELVKLLSMNLEEKRKYFFDNYKDVIFDDSYVADVVTYNEPTILITEKEFQDAIYWC